MAPKKSENPLLARPRRLSERLIKTANALNSAAELMAEAVVAIQDASRACVRLAEEIEEVRPTKE